MKSVPGLHFVYALTLLLTLALSSACTSSCSARQASMPSDTGAVENPALLDQALPAVTRLSSAIKYPPKAMGKDYIVDAAHANCTVNGEAMVFSPDCDSAKLAGLDGTAYSIFGLGLLEGLVDTKITLTWAGTAPADGECWLALSDVSHQRWQWQQLNTSMLPLSNASQYADADNNIYAAIVMVGTTPFTLTSIELPKELNGTFILTSEAGIDGGTLPVEYTGDGAGNSPPMAWANAPAGTEEYALMMTTLPGDGTTKWNWVLYSIPGAVTFLEKNTTGVGILGAGSNGGTRAYEPPASQGPGPKVYTFTIYALSAPPELPEDPNQVTGAVLTAAIAPVMLASASLSLSYTRQEI